MEAYTKKLALVALVMALALLSKPMVTNGQTFCRMTKEGLKACEPSVSSSAISPVAPSAACCLALSNADMQCLCQFKNYPRLLSAYNIDPNLAMQLPAKCNLGGSFHC